MARWPCCPWTLHESGTIAVSRWMGGGSHALSARPEEVHSNISSLPLYAFSRGILDYL